MKYKEIRINDLSEGAKEMALKVINDYYTKLGVVNEEYIIPSIEIEMPSNVIALSLAENTITEMNEREHDAKSLYNEEFDKSDYIEAIRYFNNWSFSKEVRKDNLLHDLKRIDNNLNEFGELEREKVEDEMLKEVAYVNGFTEREVYQIVKENEELKKTRRIGDERRFLAKIVDLANANDVIMVKTINADGTTETETIEPLKIFEKMGILNAEFEFDIKEYKEEKDETIIKVSISNKMLFYN